MEYTRDPFDMCSFPFDITSIGNNGEAVYLITFPDMSGCIAIGNDPGDVVGKVIEQAEQWSKYTHRLETVSSIWMGNLDFKLAHFSHFFYCPDPDWGK
jgi:hypothetical protein